MDERTKNRAAFLFFLGNLLGCEVQISLVDGRKFSGIFHTATPFEGRPFQLAIKGAYRSDGATREDKDASTGSTLIFQANEVLSMTVAKLDLTQNQELMTDASVQRKNISHLDGRQLQEIGSAWLADDTRTGLDVAASGAGSGQWDQFEANKQKFGVTSTYDENLYTKKLDRNQLTKEQIQHAERLAREIETSLSTNVHLQEERGQVDQTDVSGDWDEEDKYSGVIREKSPPGINTSARSNAHPANSTGSWRKAASASPPTQKQASPAPAAQPTSTIKSTTAAASLTDEAPSEQTKTPEPAIVEAKEEEEERKVSSEPPKKLSALNPNAKPFTLSAAAPEFKPSFAASTPAVLQTGFVPVPPQYGIPIPSMMPYGGQYGMMPPPPDFAMVPPMNMYGQPYMQQFPVYPANYTTPGVIPSPDQQQAQWQQAQRQQQYGVGAFPNEQGAGGAGGGGRTRKGRGGQGGYVNQGQGHQRYNPQQPQQPQQQTTSGVDEVSVADKQQTG